MGFTTAEAAQAALMLGPVEVVCNVCGRKHVVSLDRNLFDTALNHCVQGRKRSGISVVQDGYADTLQQLAQIFEAADGAISKSIAAFKPQAAHGFANGCHEYVYDLANSIQHRIWAAAEAFHCNIWVCRHVAILPGLTAIALSSAKSRWMVLPSADVADAAIADCYLAGLADPDYWSGIDCDLERLAAVGAAYPAVCLSGFVQSVRGPAQGALQVVSALLPHASPNWRDINSL